ncbi:hypothetical protein DYB26_007506 [Aphanomyces astaci]|uniref:Uncharacterized protein n=1 Tax=Aphanomyces astaci TaxID=112090 RepID=A0A397EYH8_APHAT|nr:hypothetical protein DYB26_007506 [Aphanomyces astaci]RHZ09027.1 hypothetical protein DYB31_002043 [Aphanomyces astaci]
MDRQDEVSYSTCPVLNKILGDSGEEGVRVMTNFTRREFDILWRHQVARGRFCREAVRKDAAKRKLEGVENSGLVMRQLVMAELETSAKKIEDAEITPIKRRKKSKKPAPTLDIASLMGIIREGFEDKERREAQQEVTCTNSVYEHIAPSLVQRSCGRADDVAAGLDGTPEFICNGEKSTGLSQASTQDCKCLERLHLIGARCTDKGWQS